MTDAQFIEIQVSCVFSGASRFDEKLVYMTGFEIDLAFEIMVVEALS